MIQASVIAVTKVSLETGVPMNITHYCVGHGGAAGIELCLNNWLAYIFSAMRKRLRLKFILQ